MPAAGTTPTPDSYWVVPGRLLAGAYPRELAPFHEAGVSAFVDLTEGEYGIPDRTCPSPAAMTRILDRIDGLLAEGKVVYVHCLAGIGRTGTVVGCWLVRHGTSGEAARQPSNDSAARRPRRPSSCGSSASGASPHASPARGLASAAWKRPSAKAMLPRS